MQYREIVAVTGLGGLFHLLATKSDGAIVRALADDSTRFIPSRLHSVTPLESIEIYTTGANVRLHEVLQKMKESSTARPDAKASPADIRGYFSNIFPEIDGERVYTSDMKKMLKWFDILQGADLLDFSTMNTSEDSSEALPEDNEGMPAEGEAQITEHDKEGGDTEVQLVEEGEEKPAKKARAKKAAPVEEDEERAPKKTTARKAAKPEKE